MVKLWSSAPGCKDQTQLKLPTMQVLLNKKTSTDSVKLRQGRLGMWVKYDPSYIFFISYSSLWCWVLGQVKIKKGAASSLLVRRHWLRKELLTDLMNISENKTEMNDVLFQASPLRSWRTSWFNWKPLSVRKRRCWRTWRLGKELLQTQYWFVKYAFLWWLHF